MEGIWFIWRSYITLSRSYDHEIVTGDQNKYDNGDDFEFICKLLVLLQNAKEDWEQRYHTVGHK